jgi:uncharacterized protein YecE (DUF72 family)
MKNTKWEAINRPVDLTKKGFYIGSAGFNFKDWVGRFYPPKFSNSKLLDFYQQYFRFVELDCVHQTKLRAFFEEIAKQSSGNICYGIRAPRELSTPSDFKKESGIVRMKHFLSELSPLVECGRVYSVLFQVSSDWARTQERLDYLCATARIALDLRVDVHFEFRNRSWHEYQVLDVMRNKGIGICNTEVPSVRAFPCRPYRTTEKGYFRYLGKNYGSWKKLGWKKNPHERTTQKEELFDYLYKESEVQEKVIDQIKLSKKVSAQAVVFCNCTRAQSVVNSVQNIQQLQNYFDIQKITY